MNAVEKEIEAIATRTGDVSAEEIRKIMLGEDLIKVSKSDVETLFNMKGLKRKIAFSVAPILNSVEIAKITMITLLTVAVQVLMFVTLPVNHLVAGYVFLGALAAMYLIIGGGIVVDESDFENEVPFDIKTPIGSFLSIGMCGAIVVGSIITIILGPEVSKVSATADLLAVLHGAMLLGNLILLRSLYRAFREFADDAIDLKYEQTRLYETSYYSGRKSEIYKDKQLEETIAYFIRSNNIPKSVGYNLMNHAETGKYAAIEFVHPILDTQKYDANQKMKRAIARDPAVLLVRYDNDARYMVGAWDIQGDQDAIMEKLKANNDAQIKAIGDVASRISQKAKNALLKAMKEKTNLIHGA